MNMETLLAVAGLITVGAITPGPNNLIVLRAASRAGVVAALPAVAGIVLGGLTLLALAAAGAGALFATAPGLRVMLAAAGCLYLGWLGARLVTDSYRPLAGSLADDPAHTNDDMELPAGMAGLFGFQFLNPKSWVLVLTAISAARSAGGESVLPQLAILFIAIPAVCLLLWSWFGALLTRHLRRHRVRAWFDRTMGVLLVVSAVLLLLSAVR